MALQEIHDSGAARCIVVNDRCVVHGMQVTEELGWLHGRVAELERALADAAQPQARVIPLDRSAVVPVKEPDNYRLATAPVATDTQTVPQRVPAPTAPEGHTLPTAAIPAPAPGVTAAVPGSAPRVPAQVPPAAADLDDPLSEANAFAEAWDADESSFEERFAARQFFQDNGPISPSRKWLLG